MPFITRRMATITFAKTFIRLNYNLIKFGCKSNAMRNNYFVHRCIGRSFTRFFNIGCFQPTDATDHGIDRRTINGFDPKRSANKMFDCVLTIFSSPTRCILRYFTVTSIPIVLACSFFINLQEFSLHACFITTSNIPFFIIQLSLVKIDIISRTWRNIFHYCFQN